MKIKYFLIIFCALLITVYGPKACNPDPNLSKISFNDYDTIRIDNRGTKLSFNKLVLFKRSEIAKFCSLLKLVKQVKQSNINTKANQGLCDISMTGKKRSFKFPYIQTTYSGGIIITDNAIYRNDSLFYFLNQLTL